MEDFNTRFQNVLSKHKTLKTQHNSKQTLKDLNQLVLEVHDLEKSLPYGSQKQVTLSKLKQSIYSDLEALCPDSYQVQLQLREDQDKALDELGIYSKTLKNYCYDMEEEIDVHNHLLDSLDSKVTYNSDYLQKTQEKLASVLNRTSNFSLCCIIALLSSVLLVLIIYF